MTANASGRPSLRQRVLSVALVNQVVQGLLPVAAQGTEDGK